MCRQRTYLRERGFELVPRCRNVPLRSSVEDAAAQTVGVAPGIEDGGSVHQRNQDMETGLVEALQRQSIHSLRSCAQAPCLVVARAAEVGFVENGVELALDWPVACTD